MPMPKDARDLFDIQLPAVLKKDAEKAREVNAIFLFKLEGDGGGEWTVNLVSDPPVCAKGDAGGSQCTIEMTHEDFMAMLADPQLGMQLYFQGKLRIVGDPTLSLKLQEFFSLSTAA
jgi:hypothetical protein